MKNPFREDLVSRNKPEPCSVVIFGATGDLAHRKLVPALYNLSVDGELPSDVKIIGFARREKSDEVFRDGLAELNQEVSRTAMMMKYGAVLRKIYNTTRALLMT